MSVQGSDALQDSPTPRIEWTRQVASIMAAWADGAKSYRWLHEEAYRRLKRKAKMLNFPIIILQSLAGFASVSMQGYVPEEYMRWAQLGVGVINFLGTTLSTILNWYRFTQRSEAHYQAMVGWSRLGRLISNELSLERRFRKDASEFFKVCKSEYERLMEMSPKVPSTVEEDFDVKFRGKRRAPKKKCCGGRCACCCPTPPPEDDGGPGDSRADSNKSQAKSLGIVFPDISDHLEHTKTFEEKEDSATQNDTPDFVLHKPPTPLAEERRARAHASWSLLKEVITKKKDDDAPSLTTEDIENHREESLRQSESAYRRRASQPPKLVSNPAFVRPPIPLPVDETPSISVKERAKQFASLFGPTIAAVPPVPDPAPPAAADPQPSAPPPPAESPDDGPESPVEVVVPPDDGPTGADLLVFEEDDEEQPAQ